MIALLRWWWIAGRSMPVDQHPSYQFRADRAEQRKLDAINAHLVELGH